MHRQLLLRLLRQHQPVDLRERTMTADTITFVEQQPDCFWRSLLVGHVTGSAWVVSPDHRQVVLLHHRKLDRWFQPGGHADGDPDVAAVALREAQEETGLTSLRFADQIAHGPAIFDVDIHLIPARLHEPEHLHYDIRFLLEADPSEPFGFSEERQNIRWFTAEEVKTITIEPSIIRMLEKI